jgi:hypothetical protein
MDLLVIEGVRWFWDLTCDFWAVFEENIFGGFAEPLKLCART